MEVIIAEVAFGRNKSRLRPTPGRTHALEAGRLADGRDDLAGPAGQRLVAGGVIRASVDEAARAVFEDRVGQLVDPLPLRAADPAPVVASGSGERLGRDAPAEVEDVGDLRGIAACRGRGVVDLGPGLAVQRAL